MTEAPRFRVVLAEPLLADAVDRLRIYADVRELPDSSPQSLVGAVHDADALIIRTRTHVTARVLEAAPHLKVIGRAGTRVDHIDLRLARQRGIDVVYAPHAATRSVVEFTLAMILALHHGILQFDRRLREGEFDALRTPNRRVIGRLVLGFLGLNDVAESLGRLVSTCFGTRVIYHDPLGGKSPDFEAESVDLDELLTTADILSLHLPPHDATRNILTAERLSRLKPGSILVNTNRNGLLDEDALAEMLKTRRLAGAALDVFNTEPLPADHPLRRAPNCILTPHVAAATLDVNEAALEVVEDVLRVLQGQRPRYPAPIHE